MAYYERFYAPSDGGHGKIVCDACAEAGIVPFKVLSDGVPHQERPWCWVPHYGTDCHDCGKPA
jgi:hypothetical protein